MNKQSDGFLLGFWAYIFKILSQISLFSLICKLAKKRINQPYLFVEVWVVSHLFLAILSSYILTKYEFNNLFIYLIVFFGIARVFEILVYQINVILFDPYRAWKEGKKYKVKSVTRMLVLLIHNYFEIMFWYASAMIGVLQLNSLPIDLEWSTYIKSSFLCLATLDSETVIRHSHLLTTVAFAETISGIILTIISIARCINNLPAVEELDSSR